jgi:large subunit ribosomal protein L22
MKEIQEMKEIKVKAQAKWVRSGSRKIRRIVNLMRGKAALTAIAELRFYPQKGARLLLDVIKSAVANAKHNHKLDEASLYISEAYVDDGTFLKRFKAASRGRAAPRKRRTSHVTVFVSPIEREEIHGSESTSKRV